LRNKDGYFKESEISIERCLEDFLSVSMAMRKEKGERRKENGRSETVSGSCLLDCTKEFRAAAELPDRGVRQGYFSGD
jgi:hypothetical protein